MISLQRRLILTYALFISGFLSILAFGVNVFAGKIFEGFIKDAIKARNGEIVDAIGALYDPARGGFDGGALDAVGMLFVHDGYIVDVEDSGGERVWDARDMNMRHCVEALREIGLRMRTRHGLESELQNTSFFVEHGGARVGQVNIATVGPFFYTEAQGRFLASLSRLLIASACVFIVLSVFVSIVLGRSIARPINAASAAARGIATFYAAGGRRQAKGPLETRLREEYRTEELTELSKSINALGGELAEGERRQRQLTADIAHELRTPLAGLQGTVEAMIDGVWAPTAERLAACHEEIVRLAKLIEDMRVLTGLEWEDVALREVDVDLAALLERVASDWRAGAQEKGVELWLKVLPATIRADYDRTKQVFINLVSNAVKYTDRGHIGITLDRERGGGGGVERLVVTVEDTGMGIAARDMPHIFERFFRTDKSRSRNTGGCGIGLSIAGAIAAAQGWELRAESVAGRGSRFSVVI